MRFAEYYRAKRVLLITLVVVAAIVALALALYVPQIAAYGRITAWVSQLERAPGSSVSRQTNSGGRSVTVIYNAREHIHVRLLSGGGVAPSISVTVPNLQAQAVFDRLHSLRGTTDESEHDGVTDVRQDFGNTESASSELVRGMGLALIIATILGGALAKENSAHLALAWTRPASRLRYALGVFFVDACAIALSALLGGLALLIVAACYVGHVYRYDGAELWAIPSGVLIPVAWYALLTAVSASMRRGLAVVTGLTCALGVIILQLARVANDQPGPGADALSHIAQVVNVANPLHYLDDAGPSGAVRYAVALAVLTVVYLAAAVIQWRRAEV